MLASKASDGLSARRSSSYEASVIQARQYSSKAKQTITEGVANETCKKLKVLDNELAITLKWPR
jgi:hypothetical protein